MSRLKLSLGFSSNHRSKPIIDGTIKPDGIDFIATSVHGSELFWRQLEFSEFDVSEMSLSSLLMLLAGGDRNWVALPIFTYRRFFHTSILVNASSGIQHPADLRGKKVGVPEYQQTAALWTRGILQHEFGVSPHELNWYMERGQGKSHGSAIGFIPPEGVHLQYIPEDKSIGEWLVSGELDATVLYLTDKNLVDRSRLDLSKDDRVRTIFEDPVAEGARYYQKTGIFPINHCVVVRRSILEEHPWIALNVYHAFTKAKESAKAYMKEMIELYGRLGVLSPETSAIFNHDPYEYGIKHNLNTLNTLIEYSFEQGLIPRKLSLEEIFAPSTLSL